MWGAVSSRLPDPWMWGMLAVFASLSILGTLNHEPWRDEAQAWLIARDCPDLASVIRIAGYEGHPALWHLLLRPVAKAGLPFVAASLAHFLIILAAVVLFLRHAPFTHGQKALFVFGYYVLYEYNILVRNYALSVLLLFALAALHRLRFVKPITYAALLALLANTTLFGLIIAFALVALGWIDFRRFGGFAEVRRCMLALLLIAAGFTISIYQLWPPSDVLPPKAHSGSMKDSLFDLRFSQGHLSVIPRALVGAFLPLPQAGPHFWNSRLVHLPLQEAGLLDGFPAVVRWAYGTLMVCPALLSAAFLARKTEPLLFYLFVCGALLGVFLIIYEAGLRHHGFLFMLFIFSAWISQDYNENRLASPPLANKWLGARNSNRLLVALLVVQVVAAASAFYSEWKYDFSSGKKAVAFLKEEGLLSERVFIAAYPSKIVCALLVHVEAPNSRVYMVEYQREGSYMVWNREYMVNQALPLATVVARVDQAIAGRDWDRAILITNSKVASEWKELDLRYQLIASFGETVERQESFCIYELRKPSLESAVGWLPPR